LFRRIPEEDAKIMNTHDKKPDGTLPAPKKISETSISALRERFSFRLFNTHDSPLWTKEKKRIVVIGSGIGGMAAGALFAKIGHRVNVLEMNPSRIGGHGRWLVFRGMKYSMGPQYVWEFGEGELGSRFLEFLGLKKTNPFVLMERDGFERIFIGNRNESANSYFLNFKVPLGLENFRKGLTALFPEEREKLDSLFNDMIGIYNTFKKFFDEHAGPEGRIFLATKFFLGGEAPFSLKLKLGQTIFLSLKEWFDQYGISGLPRRILYAHGGIFAESESEMSAIAYIVGTGNYHKGARYPGKGFHHFFESLAGLIQENGGSVEKGKKVARLKTRNGLVTSAVCEDGTEYPCDFIFSDISPRLTCALLKKNASKLDYTPSHSVPTICIGLKKGLESIAGMKGRNYWWQDGNEVKYDAPDVTLPPRMLFANSPTANIPGSGRDEDKDAIVVFCPGNYRQEKEIYRKGGDAVRKFKKKLAADVVDILDRNVLPGLKSKLLFAEVISSIDIEEQTNGEMGNAYGRRMNVKEIMKGQIEEEGFPGNLFNVSATKNTPGIAGGISTAAILFEELTGKKI
jgi:phytoene dehydrogenase-like protein